MTTTLAALVSALLLSELAFDPRDTAYWHRWLGRFGCLWRRTLLAVIPALLAVTLVQILPERVEVMEQLITGAVLGTAAAAMLRADARGMRVRAPHAQGQPGEAYSVLSWAHKQLRRRFDELSRRRIIAFLDGQKVVGPGHPERLLITAEEVAAVLGEERRGARARERRELQESLEVLWEHMDVLRDPEASDSDRRKAAFTLAESLAKEMANRRWDRLPAYDRSKGRR
ncbi:MULTISPECIES: hypothetical protein [Streptomyces]|uniref:hypothetical protein n=1 Tax=Streptomyces TaxID=1883 RepID=UPI0022494592|nr:hypothetical protein [Streptomyces sp. JHD 1]MCX2968762.1 hypothetical protein [Streptomyces sp. JHD 1]